MTPDTAARGASWNETIMSRPLVLLFDVNETLLDIGALAPFFERVFGDRRVMRDWYAQLVVYSQAITFAGQYIAFSELGAGVLRMLGALHGKTVDDTDVAELAATTTSLPAHPGVPEALERLRDAGFRLATLTNSAPSPSPTPLEKTALAPYFEMSLSVETVRRFKPASECYLHAAATLAVAPADICMVATHIWDLFGAQAVGCRAAFVSWADNALLPVDGLPQPDVAAPTMAALAEAIIRRWP